MKIILLNIFIVCFCAAAVAGNQNQKKNKDTPTANQTNVIDAGDTVVFDLSQQVLAGNNISFPVYILSDDTVFSLDFSLKYNLNSFDYDTTIDIVTYLISNSHYNSGDSTVRYTSSSLQPIANNTPLTAVHFITLLSGPICSPDLYSLKAYLNGDLCSVKVMTCSSAGLVEYNNKSVTVKVYPNPASEILNIELPEKATVQLLDLAGRTMLSKTDGSENQKINICNIPNGIYMLKVFNDNFISLKKVVINK